MGVIKLPIPIFSEGKEFRDVTIRPLLAGVIADTNKVVQKGDAFRGMQTFIAGGIESIGDITEKTSIFEIVGDMSYRSANFIATKIIFQDEKDDGVEGYYKCPRCGEPKICEFNENSKLDTRDYISDLPIIYLKDEGEFFTTELTFPVDLKDADNKIDGIFKMKFRYPTLNDCSMAFNKVGDKDKVRLQFQIYIQSLMEVNDVEVSGKFKNNFGMFIFDRMNRKDISVIADMCDKYGMNTEVKKVCNSCQKDFEVNINTSNFFASALR